ncbi:hypothetical protein HDU96_000933 [Phlyctochytrium bullatum]|nr:hypothetical protein HDU96_000933 [Phlyctochytrium bullatum]
MPPKGKKGAKLSLKEFQDAVNAPSSGPGGSGSKPSSAAGTNGVAKRSEPAPDGGIKLAPHPAAIKAAQSAPAPNEEEDLCHICTDPITFYSVGECNHRICHLCSLRLRALLKDQSCPLCKTALPKVVYTADAEKPFADYDIPKLPRVDQKLQIYFDEVRIFEDVMILLRFNCPEPTCDVACPDGWPELKRHVQVAHGRQLCDLCTRYQKLFTHEHTLFTASELDKHYKVGDENDKSFKGHPFCGFCKTHFYGDDELYEHCRKEHEQCFLCSRAGIRHQYYLNYNSLEQHFRADHFACLEPECLEKKFQVFATDIDMKAHDMEMHPHKRTRGSKGEKIELNFQYAGGPSSSSGGGRRRQNQSARGGNGSDDRRSAPAPAPAPEPLPASPPIPAATPTRSTENDFPTLGAGGASRPTDTAPGTRPLPPGAAPRSLPPGASPRQVASAVTVPRPAASAIASGVGRGPKADDFPSLGSARAPATDKKKPIPAESAPTPAESYRPSPSASASSSRPSSAEEGDVVSRLQSLFGGDETKFTEFKGLASRFRQSTLDAESFFSRFLALAQEGCRTELDKRNAELNAFSIWTRISDTIPEDDPKAKWNPNNRQKGKREQMLEALNNHRARRTQSVSDDFRSNSSPSYAQPKSFETPGSNSSSSARVLVIKSKASKQKIHAGSSNPLPQSGWNEASEGRGFVATFSGASSAPPPSAPTPTVVAPVSQIVRSTGSAVRMTRDEFPGLPKAPPKDRLKKDTPTSVWKDGGASSSAQNDPPPETGKAKKNKKGKEVLLHFG